MRAAVLLLILANVILFGYARLDRAAQSEAGRLGMQVQPDRIRVLTSQQVAALAPGKVSALADVCARMEAAARANDWQGVTANVEAFRSEMARLNEYLEGVMATHG